MVESVSIPDYAECLDNIKGETNKLVKMFNDLCREQGEQSYLIDLEEIRNDVKDMAKGQVSKIVNMAKAWSLESLGNDEAATQLLKRYI